MKLNNKKTAIFLTVLIVLSLTISTFFMISKQGFHEDELLTYNLANSSKQLDVNGGWNTPEDFNEYLTVSPEHRFDYGLVYENQIIDASHPPFYYALVHTVCSIFPQTFSKYLAFSINIFAMTGILIMLFKIAKIISKNNLYSLIATATFALSIACFTMTIYLRMYSTLTFLVLSMIYMNLKIYEQKNTAKARDFIILGVIALFGTLTQYYFILFEGLTGLIMLVFKIKEKNFKDLRNYIIAVGIGSVLALCIYPFIITNVLGGNRGLGSMEISVDLITIVTYVIYKICTYFQVLAKDVFINQVWLFVALTIIALAFAVYMRFVKKEKLSRTAFMAFIPSLIYFIAISLLSPFNSDRYVMASLPLIVTLFVFIFLKIARLTKNKKLFYTVPVCIAIICAVGLISVKPYYTYGKKPELYTPQTGKCVFVGTAMLEWNKTIDKLALYDEVMIVQTDEFSSTLDEELEAFATDRGIITNGKITEFMDGYMNNGGEKEKTDSMSALKTDEKLNNEEYITVYISRLADEKSVIEYFTANTKFKKHDIISSDYAFNEFYNWYDYFVETESYCNVYRFY
ncbi:MAG: glycosyltransferase family 39 protein [Ruminococcus sp.]|nr:glycosyltransferase family 39 protein [Ruminococcus sp.]